MTVGCAPHIRDVVEYSLSAVLLSGLAHSAVHILDPGSGFWNVSWVCRGDLPVLCGCYWMTEVKKGGEETALFLLGNSQLDDLHWDKGAVSSSCFLPSPGRALYYVFGGGRQTKECSGKSPPPDRQSSLSFGSRCNRSKNHILLTGQFVRHGASHLTFTISVVCQLGVVAHVCHLSIWEDEAKRLLQVQSQPWKLKDACYR